LRGGLTSDAAVDVGLAGEILIEVPNVGDGVAEEDDAILSGRGRGQFFVGFVIRLSCP